MKIAERPDTAYPPQWIPDFLLGSAVIATRRFTGIGLALRTVCLLVVVVCSFLVYGLVDWRLMLIAPMAIGLFLAALEWAEAPSRGLDFRNPILVALALKARSNQGRAAIRASGLLEVAVGPICVFLLFNGPIAKQSSVVASVLGTSAVVLFTAVAVFQVVTHAGYFNSNEGLSNSRLHLVGRWILPLLVAAVLFGLVSLLGSTSISRSTSMWVSAVVLLLYFPLRLGDQIQHLAAEVHAQRVDTQLKHSQKNASETMHYLKTVVRSQIAVSGNDRGKEVVRRILAEVEGARQTILSGNTELPIAEIWTSCEEILSKIGETFGATQIDFICARPQTPISRLGAGLMRHVILDLATNSIRRGAPTVKIRIAVGEPATFSIPITIDVDDDGPLFEVPETPRQGSSAELLVHLLQANRGGLRVTSTTQDNKARATFRVARIGEPA